MTWVWPPYIGGLAAWRLGHPTEARQVVRARRRGPRRIAVARAAGRVLERARGGSARHDPADAARWLHRAAAERDTLHGLIARRMLGLPTGIVPSSALLSQADVDAVAATDAGRRAFALLQVGQPERAAASCAGCGRRCRTIPPLRRALLLVAAGVGLTDCAAQLAAWTDAVDPDAGDAVAVRAAAAASGRRFSYGSRRWSMR